MHYPKISIVTPSFNQGNYIEETILSIINQGYPNLEYIIIDGGSTDNTIEIIKKYEQHLAYWESERDHGQSHAINKGLAKCTGEIFNWINSDDLLAPKALFTLAKAFTTQSEKVDVVCGFTDVFEGESSNVVRSYRMGVLETAEETIYRFAINQPGTFFRLSVVKELNGVNEALHFAMDADLWVRYLVRYGRKNIVLIEEVLAKYREHTDTKTSTAPKKFMVDIHTFQLSLLKALNAPAQIINLFSWAVINEKYENNWIIGTDFKRDFFLSFWIKQAEISIKHLNIRNSKSYLFKKFLKNPRSVTKRYYRGRLNEWKPLFRLKTQQFLESYDQKIKYRGGNIKGIPIIINNYNRLDCLKLLIQWLEKVGYTNIFILDNASTYPPLLEYYRKTPYKVIKLNKNFGYLAIWKSGVYNQFKYSHYVYTDPDILPIEECPSNFMEHFLDILNRYPVEKVGFGLKIDDLPDHYSKKQKVIYWEKQFWKKEVEPGVYDADIDTTFALYKPLANGGYWAKAYRTGHPYVARHLPWYANDAAPTEEDLFYQETITAGASHWIEKK